MLQTWAQSYINYRTFLALGSTAGICVQTLNYDLKKNKPQSFMYFITEIKETKLSEEKKD